MNEALAATAATVLTAVIAWLSTRNKSKADTAEKLVASAMLRMDRSEARSDILERKHDTLEGDVRDLRRALYPHQQWDLRAHRKALETDPDFPAPPELHI